jgi:hypothetical protein
MGAAAGLYPRGESRRQRRRAAEVDYQTTLKKSFAVTLNPDQKEIYVTDTRLNGVTAIGPRLAGDKRRWLRNQTEA